jgi:glutathione S-transferase
VRKILSEFERLKGDGPFLAGPTLSLADIYLAPVISHFRMTPDAEEMLSEFRGLRAWWDAMSTRASMANTQPKFG